MVNLQKKVPQNLFQGTFQKIINQNVLLLRCFSSNQIQG